MPGNYRYPLAIFGFLISATIGGCGIDVQLGTGRAKQIIDFSNADSGGAPRVTSEATKPDRPVDSMPFVEGGAYFSSRGGATPAANRVDVELCSRCWLIATISTQNPLSRLDGFLTVVGDPDAPHNPVLRLSTPEHTDGAILRSRSPLPKDYRISFRIGHIDYGDESELNGYDSGDETGAPWMDISAIKHNGVYWASIIDTPPAPHNNIWSHHHRKFFIDAWNTPGRIWGVTVAGVNGLSSTDHRFGKKFIAHDGVDWRPNVTTPAFFYLPDEWYDVTLSRQDDVFSFRVSGRFRGMGETTLAGSLDAKRHCVFHYNRSPDTLSEKCVDGEVMRIGETLIPTWPHGSAYPDYFMMGDPHVNFYEGSVLIDDLRLEVL
jgi:hypothetical protein